MAEELVEVPGLSIKDVVLGVVEQIDDVAAAGVDGDGTPRPVHGSAMRKASVAGDVLPLSVHGSGKRKPYFAGGYPSCVSRQRHAQGWHCW